MVGRDYFLYSLTWQEFERLVVQICDVWFGVGTTEFSDGRDGGRDAKFTGTANCFPSQAKPWSGHTVIQSKHTTTPNASCSDSDFKKYFEPDKGVKRVSELPKIKRLLENKILDNYICFTNRKLTGGADEKTIETLTHLGVKNAEIIGIDRINRFLRDNPEIARTLPTANHTRPFEFTIEEMIEVITEMAKVFPDVSDDFDSETDFTLVNKKKRKNKINKMSESYYQTVVVNQCMPMFERMRAFLENDRNEIYRKLYHDMADELRQKIVIYREQFDMFEDIIIYIYEQVRTNSTDLRGRRRYVTFLLCYMYFDCDIGERE